MGLLTLVEDRPTPSAVYNWRVYALACVASFASCMIGYDSAFIGTTIALDSFKREFNFASLSSNQLANTQANIVSVYQAGAFFGAFFAYVGGYYLGRRLGLAIFALIFLLGAGIMLAADGYNGAGLAPIYAGRVLAGVGVGGCSNLTPIYISELSPPAVRGRLVGIYELGWQIGGLVGFWIVYGLNATYPSNHTQWLIPFAVQLIPGGLLLIGTLWIKESPRWLYSKGRRAEGLKNLLWIRQLEADDVYIVEEVAAIDQAIEAQYAGVGEGFWAPFKALKQSKSVQWRFFLGGMLFLWQNGSGINAINYYSPTVFKSIGISGGSSSFLTTGIFGVVKTVFAFVWLLLIVDKFGRRNVLMIGSVGGSISMWIIGALVKIQVPSSAAAANAGSGLSSLGYATVFFFYLWTTFYSGTWNGTPWVINSEMFDPTTRGLGQASAAANNWFWNFIVSRFTPNMFNTMQYGVYFFFASLMILSAVFVWFLIPETKSVPLERMDRLFAIKPSYKANKTVISELKHEDEMFRRRLSTVGEDGLNLAEKKRFAEHMEDAQESRV